MTDAEDIARRRRRERAEFKRQQERESVERMKKADEDFIKGAKEWFDGSGWDSSLGSFAANPRDRELFRDVEKLRKPAARSMGKRRQLKRAVKKAAPAIKRAKAKKSGGKCLLVALGLLVGIGALLLSAGWGVLEAVHAIVA